MRLYIKSCIITLILMLTVMQAGFAQQVTIPQETASEEYTDADVFRKVMDGESYFDTQQNTEVEVEQASDSFGTDEQNVSAKENLPAEDENHYEVNELGEPPLYPDENILTTKEDDLDSAEKSVEENLFEQTTNTNSGVFNGILEKEGTLDNQGISFEENEPDAFDEILSNNESYNTAPVLEGRVSKFKNFMKGERAPDSLMAGMWSHHFSSNSYRETHNLGGFQYKGIFLGTFANSHSDQVVALTVARTVYKKNLTKNLKLDVGYKLGPMYGYDEGAPDIGGLTLLPAANVGISYRGVGLMLNLFPSSAISFNTYIDASGWKWLHKNKSETPELEVQEKKKSFFSKLKPKFLK